MRLKNFMMTLLLLLAVSRLGYAYTQNEKLWVGLMAERSFTHDPRWKYFIFAQERYTFQKPIQNSPWQANLLEGAIGRVISSNQSLWLGYRLTLLNPTNGFTPDNRFFQQYLIRFGKNDKQEWIYRLRLEETSRKYQNQISVRLRNRLAIGFNQPLFSSFMPMLYEEVFFQLNYVSYMPKTFVNENRLFIGGNWMYSRQGWVEIGYINQYQARLPQQSQSIISHVLSIVYFF